MTQRAGRLRTRLPGGLSLRALAPNAVTAAALASGLTGIRFAVTAASNGAIGAAPANAITTRMLPFDDWQKAILAVALAGVLDGLDGRVARMLKAQSRFGAELDSLSDAVSFGVAPALIMFLWALQQAPRYGWYAALAFAICMALRLARFNARIDMADEPRKQAGFLTGVPAPIGAGLALLPMDLWIASGREEFRQPGLVSLWLVAIAFLLISSLPTISWGKLRPRRKVRLELIAAVGLVFAALLEDPWWTLAGLFFVYLALMPVGIMAYARVKRQRAVRPSGDQPAV